MTPDRLPPMLDYYGSKWRLASKYPVPRHDTVIEPFAGGAGYSLFHYKKRVILYDVDPIVCSVWDFLIRATREEILALPLLEPGQTTDELNICQEARWLIGFWVNAAVASPRKQLSRWGIQRVTESKGQALNFWCEGCRARIAHAVDAISHWEIHNASYDSIPNQEATWFVDPPYTVAGHHYRFSSVDYSKLAAWCRSRNGQVMVCEMAGADWLPFQPFSQALNAKRAINQEVIWTNDPR